MPQPPMEIVAENSQKRFLANPMRVDTFLRGLKRRKCSGCEKRLTVANHSAAVSYSCLRCGVCFWTVFCRCDPDPAATEKFSLAHYECWEAEMSANGRAG